MGSSRPQVSAIMPAFDAAATIEAAVASVQAQTEAHWELVVVDDGSTDETLTIVRRMARDDPRISVWSISHRGRGAARNVALLHVRGRYVALCDADDLSRPQRFECQRAALDARPELFAVGAALAPFVHDTELGVLGTRRWPSDSASVGRRFSQLRMAVPNCAVMMRTEDLERVGPYDEELPRAQDLDLFLRAHRLGLRFENLDEVLVDYRQDARIQSFRYYRTNAVQHARVVKKHARGLRALAPFAAVHRLGPVAHPPRYAIYRLKRRLREGAI
jgi:glycosyltransferase involved in cell wall biosynthesis